jgi:sugar lactone lactonase YvrE
MAAALAIPGGTAHASTASKAFPDIIDLPAGFQPEGIAAGPGPVFYVGSILDGAIYRGSLATGRGEVLVPGRAGGTALGLELDGHGRLWVAGTGGTTGATVYDPCTGRKLAEYNFGGTFVNDVVVTAQAAYFTDSYQPVLYSVPLGRGGRLPAPDAARTIQLPAGLGAADAFNNGIETLPDGRLVIVQMLADRLYAFNPATGTESRLDLGGATVLRGDGLLRRGPYLYVVRNFANVIAKFRLRPGGAELVREITSPAFDIPATVASFGSHLYAVNARFNLPEPAPTDTYTVVRVPA